MDRNECRQIVKKRHLTSAGARSITDDDVPMMDTMPKIASLWRND